MTNMKNYWNMSKWELFLDGFDNIGYAINCFVDIHTQPAEYTFIRDDFFELLSWGWMGEYIYPYDDVYNPYLSAERKLRLGSR